MGVSLFEYLGQQVLEQQAQEVQVFLLRTSLLDEFDPALCEAVLAPLYEEPQDWQKLLEIIRQKNLYALPVGTDGQWLRYHHLFRDYLQDRYRRDLPQEIIPTLQRLAQVRERQGEWEAAYQLYKKMGDPNALADMIERAGTTMYQNALLTLEAWLDDLPPSVVRQRPGLLSLRGAVEHMRGHASEAVTLLDAAISQLEVEENVQALAVGRVRRGHAYSFLGSYERAIEDASAAMKLTEDKDDLQGPYADALRLRGLNRFYQGRSLEAA